MDAQVRVAEREGDLLAVWSRMLRADETIGPKYGHRARRCAYCASWETPAEKIGVIQPGWKGCPKCDGCGRIVHESKGLLQLACYLGCETAKQLVPEPWGWVPVIGETDIDIGSLTWARVIESLTLKLPDRAVTCDCLVPGHDCKNSVTSIPAARWLMVTAAEAVIREIAIIECPGDRVEWIHAEKHGSAPRFRRIIQMLDLCREWIESPTRKNEYHWDVEASINDPHWLPGLWNGLQTASFRYGVKRFGMEKTRQIVCKAILERIV